MKRIKHLILGICLLASSTSNGEETTVNLWDSLENELTSENVEHVQKVMNKKSKDNTQVMTSNTLLEGAWSLRSNVAKTTYSEKPATSCKEVRRQYFATIKELKRLATMVRTMVWYFDRNQMNCFEKYRKRALKSLATLRGLFPASFDDRRYQVSYEWSFNKLLEGPRAENANLSSGLKQITIQEIKWGRHSWFQPESNSKTDEIPSETIPAVGAEWPGKISYDLENQGVTATVSHSLTSLCLESPNLHLSGFLKVGDKRPDHEATEFEFFIKNR